jgi:hypothetical protein
LTQPVPSAGFAFAILAILLVSRKELSSGGAFIPGLETNRALDIVISAVRKVIGEQWRKVRPDRNLVANLKLNKMLSDDVFL